jgi:hypothetical protein
MNNVNAHTELDLLIELDNVRVMHPEAAVRNRPANRTRSVGDVYPVKRRPQIECPRTKWILRSREHDGRHPHLPLNVLGWMPLRIFPLGRDGLDTLPIDRRASRSLKSPATPLQQEPANLAQDRSSKRSMDVFSGTAALRLLRPFVSRGP